MPRWLWPKCGRCGHKNDPLEDMKPFNYGPAGVKFICRSCYKLEMKTRILFRNAVQHARTR